MCTAFRICSLFLTLAFVPVTISARESVSDVPGSHVRGTDSKMVRLIETAIKQSATFAALVAALNETDVIVHLEESRTLPAGVDGRLVFVTTAGGVRYLRATISASLHRFDAISTAGHELQHALEVAAQAGVRDAASFTSFYERHGERVGRGYDTAKARTVGRRVRLEMS